MINNRTAKIYSIFYTKKFSQVKQGIYFWTSPAIMLTLSARITVL
jgi:hypothetical protein